MPAANDSAVLSVADRDISDIRGLLQRYGIEINLLRDDAEITASFWGAPEAGIVGKRVYVRGDTPMHSLLHECAHIICMTTQRREALNRDAGGDDIEEAGVCYLQIVLSDYLANVGRDRLMRDMDAWGYSFRLGATDRWFDSDADDVRNWLEFHGLLAPDGQPTWLMRV